MPLLAVRGNAPSFGYGWGNKVADAGAMTAIASNTLSATATSVTFSSIPGSYDDLMVVCYLRGDGTNSVLANIRFNSDTGSNYSATWLYANGSSVGSASGTSATSINGSNSSSGVSAIEIQILNYANSSYNKTVFWREAQDKNGSGDTSLNTGLWRSTSAITSITIFNTNNYQIGSVFALYGIKKAA